LVLAGDRTGQEEQLFYLHFAEKGCLIPKKKLERFFTKIALRHTAMAN
jgi:hypothetical protein